MRLATLPEALDELDAEAVHLETERPGWGRKLLEEVSAVAALAAERPHLGQREPRAPAALDARRFPIKRFGLIVIVALVRGERTIVAIAPGRKKPGYWLDRVE